jgi:DNA mismatch repair protein MutL
VRFQDSGRLYSQLLAALRGKFLTTDLNTHVHSAGDQLPSPFGAGAEGDDPTGGHDVAQTVQLRQQLVDWAKGKVASWGQGTGDATRSAAASTRRDPGYDGPAVEPNSRRPLELRSLRADPCESPGSFSPTAPASAALQVHNRYLVTETAEGVTIIDQHALHERILYEQLKQRVAAGAIETQSLLVPEPVDLSPAETSAALEHRELLAELGVKVEPFGGNTLLVAGYPAMLANISPIEVLRALLERILAEGKQPDRRDLLDELLHTIACKAAIKAGDRLAPEEIASLLEQRHLVVDAHHCPHGRPTALVFTREELDKQFKRV